MKAILSRVYNYLFNPDLNYKEKMFNMLAFIGIVAGLLLGVLNAINSGVTANAVFGFIIAVLSVGLLVFAAVTGWYKAACLVAVCVIFLLYFPYLFFTMGGFHGSKIINFIFAIIFTIFLLEGKLGWFMTGLQMVVFTGVLIIAYVNPASVTPMPSEFNHMLDTVISVLFIGISVSITFAFHLRMFDRQQSMLNGQNAMLTDINLSKTKFLTNSSHEMRTPLTIISVNVQNALDVLSDTKYRNSEITELLVDTQGEIMRLSRMVGGMLTLASTSEAIERRKLDIAEVLLSTANILQVRLHEQGNKLQITTEEGLLVFGDTDLLFQALSNLIQNADKHTTNDTIRLNAERKEGIITITLKDNGVGIPPELLPRVFERGVTDGTGTGYGLYLCKVVIESHGGKIWIESKHGEGTVVYIALPNYEGQVGGDAI